MNKKITYLLLALALPVLVFIFLKVFGKNHFDIPVYYKDGAPGGCAVAYRGQYTVPDSILALMGKKNNTACLFVEAGEKNNKVVAELRRLYPEDKLQIISLEGIETSRMNRIRNCALFLKEPWKVVLVDNEKRIRGYYAFTTIEEIDRLMIETEILITNP